MKDKDITKSKTPLDIRKINNEHVFLDKALCSSPTIELMKSIELQRSFINKQFQPYSKVAESLRLSISPKIEGFASLQSSFTALSKPLLEFKSPFLDSITQMQKQTSLLQGAMSQQLRMMQNPLFDNIAQIQKQASLLQGAMSKFHIMQSPLFDSIAEMQKQTSLLQGMMGQFNVIQSRIDYFKINKAFHGITDIIGKIPKDRLAKLRLHSEYWLISDSELILAVADNENLEAEFLTDFVINYYKKNNWERLGRMIQSWHGTISQKRLSVFNSALTNTQRSPDDDVHLITVPALIAQIDGLIRDLYSTLPRKVKKRVEKEIMISLPEHMKSKRPDTRPGQVVGSIAELVGYWSAEILQEAIYEKLFQSSHSISTDSNYSLYRHKIMHGDEDFLRYGNEENFMRLMLYADFIINLINQIKNMPLEAETN